MMSKKNNEYFGIYINNKVPNFNSEYKKDVCNKYNGNIKLKFEGRAFIIEKDDNGHNREIELENNQKYRKEGKHTIKFINEESTTYYIDIQIKRHILCVLFFIVFIGLLMLLSYISFNSNIQNYMINKVSNFDVDLEGIKYVFDISYKDTDFQHVELTDKVSRKKLIYPGSSGCFYIQISTKNGNKDMRYSMEIKEEKNKPKNLNYKLDGKTYDSIKDLSEDINGIIEKSNTKTLKIDWFWDYNTNDDIQDTEEGIKSNTYQFLMRMVGNEIIQKEEN